MSEKRKSERLEAKRAAFQTDNKKIHRSLWIVLVCAGLLAGGLISYFQTDSESRVERSPVAGASTGSSFVVPVSTFDDGKAHFFTHKAGGTEIRYFVLKSSDGVIRAAFDACDVCWQAGKGYAQAGDVMVCRNCGQRFASVRVNEVKGGCNPAPLTRKVENGNLIIETADIMQGKGYFDFRKRG
ncbi:MAG: DUF2318 domain-containing protein [Desulfobacteraceae bacterium]|nr:MAG: DUF2318 domain-containing protein [Desulfobacteraceae bacterium]